MGSLLEDFLEVRASLRAAPIGGGGDDVCRALTSALDTAVADVASGLGPGVAVVAVGGYGRSELSLFSDVDLMLLHDAPDPSEAAAEVFRPLWDAGLRVGHAVRTVGEAAKAARERFDTYTTLLTSRLVIGDEELFGRLVGQITSVTKARPLRRYLVSEERQRRQKSPYLEMAVDVKTGRGGLRTLQGFEWERRREALIGRFSADTSPDEAVAHETLLTVRNALHAAAGRPHDAYSFDLREPVARWLDADLYEVGERLVHAIHTVDLLAVRRWPELVDSGDSPAKRVWSRLRGAGDRVPAEGPPSASELAVILRSGEKGRLVVDRLRESGHLTAILPEWDDVGAVPQLAPFHEHPVDAHLWRTAAEMQALVDGDDHHYAAIAAEIGDPEMLTFAAFLHDIGKGRGGDHAEVGAGIARSLCERLGCRPDVTRLVEGAVRHHLLLARTATRRDLDDPAVVTDVAETVGDLRLLQVLYLLTVADSKATGATMWNEWKATLVRTLFVRCAAHFGAEAPEDAVAGTTPDEVVALAGSERRSAVEAHLRRMPVEYLRSTTPDEVLWHVELIDGLGGASNVGVRAGDAAEAAVVVGRTRPGFRRLVAESFAANGIDVLEARLAGRSDGIVVDVFRVRDDRTGGPVPPHRWDRVRDDIQAAVAGNLDTESKVAARADAYASITPAGIEPQVRVWFDGASDESVITIECSDRIGRLAEILAVLEDCCLEIRLAKLETRSGHVVDTFYVRGEPISAGRWERERLARRIEEEISV